MKKTTPQKPRRLKTRGGSPAMVTPSVVLGVVFILSLLIFKLRIGENQVSATSIDTQFVMIDVPTRAVAKGESLKTVVFSKIKWPSLSDNSKYLQNSTAYGAYYANNDLLPYAPIPLSSLIASSIDVNAVVENIPVGFRAITVKVDIESVVEGWAQTGNFVDVIVLRQSADPELGIEAKLIAENVKILAAGATVELANNPNLAHAPTTVTLLVTQEDALKIRTASTVGKLTFALRGMSDNSPSTTVSMNQKILLGGTKAGSYGRNERRAIAKGPDGKTYILDSNAEWIRDLKSEETEDL